MTQDKMDLKKLEIRLQAIEMLTDTDTGVLLVTAGTRAYEDALKLYQSDPSNYLLIAGPGKKSA